MQKNIIWDGKAVLCSINFLLPLPEVVYMGVATLNYTMA